VPETLPGLAALAASIEKRVQTGVNQAFGLIAEQVNPLIDAATSRSDLAKRITTDWPVTYREATSLVDGLEQAIRLPTRYYLRTTPVRPTLDMVRYQQGRWARDHSMALVNQISGQTQATMARSLQRSLNEYAPLDVITMRLRRYIGLDDRYAQAVDRHRQTLLNQGVPPARAYQSARAYAARLRTARARTIARTETTRALWEGQRMFWEQAMTDGLVDPTNMRKRWRTARDERTCPICKRLHNVTLEWDDKFRLADGSFLMGPPAHPNCRCEVTVLWKQWVVSKGTRTERLERALA
jgi:hypothetical protein